MKRRFSPYRSFLFPVRAWAGFIVFFIPACVVVSVMPGRRRRRFVAHHAARVFFLLMGIPIQIKGVDLLPASGCFVASNHASYLDGPLLAAALPPRFAFLIKSEAMKTPLVGWMLQRLGSEFVERFDTKAALNQANRLVHLARSGASLGVFPEGTFEATPGLHSFHLGAFLAATRAGIPVVPVVIRGARKVLPGESRWPHLARVEIELLAPVVPAGKAVADARQLRDAVRTAMLRHLDAAERAGAQPQRGPGTGRDVD